MNLDFALTSTYLPKIVVIGLTKTLIKYLPEEDNVTRKYGDEIYLFRSLVHISLRVFQNSKCVCILYEFLFYHF